MGATDAFKESARRTRKYTADDWKRHKAEQDGVYADAAAAMRAGINAHGEGLTTFLVASIRANAER